MEDLPALLPLHLQLDSKDEWVWKWEEDIAYNVRFAYGVISDGGVRRSLHDQVWRPKSLLKVKLLVWRIFHGRLSTWDRLHRLLSDIQ